VRFPLPSYLSVSRCFLSIADAMTNVPLNRFVALPVPALQEKLGGHMKDVQTEVESLGKKLHYLETTAKNSQEHIEKMLGGGRS